MKNNPIKNIITNALEQDAKDDTHNAHIVGNPNKSDPVEMATKRLRTIGTGAISIWKTKAKIAEVLASENSSSDLKDLAKKIEMFLRPFDTALKESNVETLDRTGQRFDYGFPEKVITSIETEGIEYEEVLETHKPTIVIDNAIIQLGEIIIATPKK
jgi:hypothetical protein